MNLNLFFYLPVTIAYFTTFVYINILIIIFSISKLCYLAQMELGEQ